MAPLRSPFGVSMAETISEPPCAGVMRPWTITGGRPPLLLLDPQVTVDVVATSSALPVAPLVLHDAVPLAPETNWLFEVTV